MSLVREWFSIERLSTRTCSGRITRLDDEPRDYTMEYHPIIISYYISPASKSDSSTDTSVVIPEGGGEWWVDLTFHG